VLEVRERDVYDALLGGGTYTFKLAHRGAPACVDASATGNMAHLINHSCAPNAFSTTKSIAFARGVEERVIIVAAQDISAGAEVTYNYRCVCNLCRVLRCWRLCCIMNARNRVVKSALSAAAQG
jgi:SET domain-containing protein